MKQILFTICAALFLFLTSGSAQYLTQDFEGPWTGNPAAPSGWTQSRVVLLGDGIPEPTAVDGEKDWEQNTNTGAGTWAKNPSTTVSVKPNAAVSGTNVLYLQDYNFGSTSAGGFGSRRLESPTINLSSSTSPYVRFWLFYAASGVTNQLRVVASSDGGTTWQNIMIFTGNAAFVGTMTSTTPWQRINVIVPASYRTANSKVGIEVTNTWGTQDMWIDDFSVEEFSPTSIASVATGNWSSTATWDGGVVPSADHNVTITAGHTVTIDVNTARCRNMTIDGTLTFASAGIALQAFGNLSVGVTGTYNAFNLTTGKTTFIGGNLTNAGTVNFSVGTPTIWFTGGSTSAFSNSGTITNSRFVAVNFASVHGTHINSPLTITGAVGLVEGNVFTNGNLTLGNSAVATTQTISRGRGSFSGNPVFGAGVTRSITYTQFFAQSQSVFFLTPGAEIEDISGTRTVTGTLTMSTFNTLSLALGSFPVTVGTATTGGLTLSRGIIVTSDSRLLTLSPFVAGSTGTAPSAATPPTTGGSYVVGPLRINFPATGTTARNFPLGVGSSFNGSTPSSNVRKTVTISNTAAWASQIITASITAAPTGTLTPPLTGIFGVGTLRLDLNGGPDLPATATVAWTGRNSTFGNSDNMIGSIGELVLAQATANSGGTWTQRSAPSGSGSFVDNTDYTRTTATAAPGPVGPLATNGEYFALATIAAGQVYDSSRVTQDVTSSIFSGATNQQIIGIKVNATGGLAPLTLTQFSLNTNGTTSPADIVNAKMFYTGSSATFASTTQFGSTVNSPSGAFVINGSQALASGSNYFWITYDVSISAPTGNVLDAECTAFVLASISRTPSTTAPAGTRSIVNGNFGGGGAGTGGYYFANSTAGSSGSPTQPTYNWIDPISAGHMQITDGLWQGGATNPADDGYYRVGLTFPFTFFGASYDSVWVGTNGLLRFGVNPMWRAAYGPTTFPTASDTNRPAIAVTWMDMDTRASLYPAAGVYHGGNASHFVVTWRNVHRWNSTTDSITCQAILYPNGNVKLQYNDLQSSALTATSLYNGLISGIVNNDGTLGVGYRVKGAGGPVISSPIAVEFGLNQNALPVQLASFTARVNSQGAGVRLDWRTLSELNNFGFYVQRKRDGDAQFVELASSFVAGNGTTSQPHDYVYVDASIQRAGLYHYRLRQVDLDGSSNFTEPVMVSMSSVTGVNQEAPRVFALFQNYPNPFNPSTEIKFSVENDGKATLEVYNLLGQKIATLFNDIAVAGRYYRVSFGSNQLASGMYLYRLNSGSRTNLKKMLLTK